MRYGRMKRNADRIMITPPMGADLFIAQRIAGSTFEDIFREAVPMIFVLLIVLVVLIVFPEITLFLPKLLGYVYTV